MNKKIKIICVLVAIILLMCLFLLCKSIEDRKASSGVPGEKDAVTEVTGAEIDTTDPEENMDAESQTENEKPVEDEIEESKQENTKQEENEQEENEQEENEQEENEQEENEQEENKQEENKQEENKQEENKQEENKQEENEPEETKPEETKPEGSDGPADAESTVPPMNDDNIGEWT